MHESKVNNIKSSSSTNSSTSSANKHSNSKLPNNQSSSNTSSTKEQGKKSKNRNSSRDRQHGDDANSASTMSDLAPYSLMDDDHIDDQETINVGRLIIDLESDLEPREQAHNNSAGSDSIPTTCSTTSTTNTLYSSSSSTQFVSNSNNKGNSSNISPDSGKSCSKNNQKAGKYASTTTNSNNNNSNNNTLNSTPTSSANATNNGHASGRTVFKSSADERGELKMKITRETKPGKSEHRIIASSNQKSPSSSTNNTSSDSTIINQLNNCEDSCTSDSTLKPTQSSSSISSTKECGTSTSVGTITEPECLGPCEPGTSVTLEGIVWQETDGGILVVNVTWRGKTYVGALLDCTRHDWAPPRLCDSPASDIDSKVNKGIRAKRIVTRSNCIGLDEKNLLQTAGKLRNGKGRRILTGNDSASCSKKQRDPSDKSSSENLTAQIEVNVPIGAISSINTSESASSSANIDTTQVACEQNESISTSKVLLDKPGPNSPNLIGCNEPNCSKKYRNMNGLLYHQTHAHSGDNESSSVQDDNCSSSTKDKVLEPEKSEMDSGQRNSVEKEVPDRTDSDLNASTRAPNILHTQAQKRELEHSPSPHIPTKINNRPLDDTSPNLSDSASLPSQSSTRLSVVKNMDLERRHSSGSSGMGQRGDIGRRSPDVPMKQPFELQGPGSSINYNHQFSSLSKPSSSSSKQQPPPMQPPLPATSEEGMKPSGTSTGPPPAPHQANCYFNSAFLANTFNPYGVPPYFPRAMYDQIVPPPPTSNAAFFTRFINNMHVPPAPESPSRLLSPSMQKNLPFPPFKGEPGVLPPPVSLPNAPLHNLNSMTNPPLAGVSPNLRTPSQGDPMLPPASQPPFLPPTIGLNPALRLPGMVSPLGPVGGPQVPSLVDDPMAKFQRRFN